MSKRILLADDSAAAKKSVEQALGTDEYQIITAKDGRSALEQINTLHPHLVLAHALLPELDGYEICRQVKDTPATSHIPVLMLTGTFEPFDINRAKEVRYDGFVTKPLDGPELSSLVRRCIDSAVYPAADPVPEETVEPDGPVASEVESEVGEFSEETADTKPGDGSDAMLDRIFPEEPGDQLADESDTITVTMGSDDDLFSIVETTEPGTEDAPEAEETPLFPSPAPEPAETSSFGIWGESRVDTAEDSATDKQDDEPATPIDNDAVEEGEEEKSTDAEESSDLSWFLRKYEEEQQSADTVTDEESPETLPVDAEETVTAAPEPAEPAADTADDEAPLIVEADTNLESVEPLPGDDGAPEAGQPESTIELDDEQLERISRRVVELISESVVRDVAWEAVPDIAERLIRERIREIEAEADAAE